MEIETQYREIIRKVNRYTNGTAVSEMSELGINYPKSRGVDIVTLRNIATEIGKNHDLAMLLWRSEGFREARILATMIEDPNCVSFDQMDEWISGVYNLEIAEQACINLLDKTIPKYEKSMEWCFNPNPLVKYTGFLLLSRIAFTDKKAPCSIFENYFPAIMLSADSSESFVKRAIVQALYRISQRCTCLRNGINSLVEKIELTHPEFAQWAKSELDAYSV